MVFYFQYSCVHNYKELQLVVKVVMTLGRDQATVKSGQIVNKSSVKTNMTPESIISRRMIKYHLLTKRLKPHNIEAITQLIKAFRFTHQKYMADLKEEEKQKKKTDTKPEATSSSDLRSNHLETLIRFIVLPIKCFC